MKESPERRPRKDLRCRVKNAEQAAKTCSAI